MVKAQIATHLILCTEQFCLENKYCLVAKNKTATLICLKPEIMREMKGKNQMKLH